MPFTPAIAIGEAKRTDYGEPNSFYTKMTEGNAKRKTRNRETWPISRDVPKMKIYSFEYYTTKFTGYPSVRRGPVQFT